MIDTFEKVFTGRINLIKWYNANRNEKKAILVDLFDFTQNYFGLSASLSFSMPVGFEEAYGTTKPASGDIYLNETLWDTCEPIEPLYYFLHELRHSIQYACPTLFPKEYELNSRYVIQFDGIGYKIDNENTIEVKLGENTDYYTELYLATPCERDANLFAFRCLTNAGATGYIDMLYEMWSPKFVYFSEDTATEEFIKAVAEIDRIIDAK